MKTLELIKRGLIAGPDEPYKAFAKRVENSPPLHRPIKTPFGLSPDWLTIEYDDKGLSLWQGAATWISNGSVLIKLRKAFKTKGKYLSYSREEVLSHEAIHAARLMFSEPRFEEIFAYMSAKSKLRRFFGPLFRTPFESLLFVVVMLVTVPLQLFFPHVVVAPIALLVFLLVRLGNDHYILKKARRYKSLATLFLLTDKEIKRVAQNKPLTPDDSVRWDQIKIIP